jgi:hypothetical protein
MYYYKLILYTSINFATSFGDDLVGYANANTNKSQDVLCDQFGSVQRCTLIVFASQTKMRVDFKLYIQFSYHPIHVKIFRFFQNL